jgi:hypothetical protein
VSEREREREREKEKRGERDTLTHARSHRSELRARSAPIVSKLRGLISE